MSETTTMDPAAAVPALDNLGAAAYQNMSVIDLRKLVRDAGLARGAAVATASKGQLIALLTGEVDALAAPTLPAAGGDLASMIAAAVAPHVRAGLDEARVLELIQENAVPGLDESRVLSLVDEAVSKASLPREIVVKVGDAGTAKNIGQQHWLFPVVLACAAVRVPLYLVGPAGSGKSYAVKAAAEALGLAYHDMSVNPQTSKTDIMGYMNANGGYVETAFRRAYEHGGIFLLDEIDSANAAVLTVLNNATSNGHCTFPDGLVPKHSNFVLLAGANTFGLGANRQYVGRNQLDAATLDRFAFLEWPYDEALEAGLAGCVWEGERPSVTIKPHDLQAPERAQWLATVRSWRERVAQNGIRHVVSPRATLNGLKLLAAGIPRNMVVDMVLAKGLDADSRRKIEG